MNEFRPVVDELRRMAAALSACEEPAEPARIVALLTKAATVLEAAHDRIARLEDEKSQAFRAGMEAEAYLISTPASEDG